KARRLVIRAAEAGGVEQGADTFLARLEAQIVAQQRGTDGSEVLVGPIQRRPVRGIEVVADAERGGELEDGIAVVVGGAAPSIAAGDIEVVGGVQGVA